jgi:hypothetical protein
MKKSLDIKQVDQSSRKKPPKVKKTSEKEEGPFYTQVLYFSPPPPHQKSKSSKRFRKRKKPKIIKRFSIPHGLLNESDGPMSSSSIPSTPTHILGRCPTSGH